MTQIESSQNMAATERDNSFCIKIPVQVTKLSFYTRNNHRIPKVNACKILS